MLLIVLIGICGVGLIWAGAYTSKRYGSAGESLWFWTAVIERVLGWGMLALVVIGVLAYFFLGAKSG